MNINVNRSEKSRAGDLPLTEQRMSEKLVINIVQVPNKEQKGIQIESANVSSQQVLLLTINLHICILFI